PPRSTLSPYTTLFRSLATCSVTAGANRRIANGCNRTAEKENVMSTIIQCQGVSQAFGSKKVLQQLDFTLQQGEVAALIGPNGAGDRKSTRLNSSHVKI